MVNMIGEQQRPLTTHVVGGGITGLLIAIELIQLAKHLGIEQKVVVYEADAFGGGRGDRTASARCQLWLHTDGQLFVHHQPSVCRSLQWSTRYMQELVPYAFAKPVAFAIELPTTGEQASLEDLYRAAGVGYEEIKISVARQWLKTFRLPPGCRVYRVDDGTMDLPLLSYGLVRHARSLDAALVRQAVARLDLQGGVVRSLVLAGGDRVLLAPSDQVVLACGSHIRPLLADEGIAVPGLRHYQCHLLATGAFSLNVLAVVHGIANTVPHYDRNGHPFDIIGDGLRFELPPECDNRKLEVVPEAEDNLHRVALEWFGLRVPGNDRQVWPAIKTEIVLEGARSQSHHARSVPGLDNAWLVLPGKLSQAAAAARDLALRVVRQVVEEPVARSIWEQVDEGSLVPPPAARIIHLDEARHDELKAA